MKKLFFILTIFLTTSGIKAQNTNYLNSGTTSIRWSPSASCDGRPMIIEIDWKLDSYLGVPAYNVKVKPRFTGDYAYINGKKVTFSGKDSDLLALIKLPSYRISAEINSQRIGISYNFGLTSFKVPGFTDNELLKSLKSGAALHSFQVKNYPSFDMYYISSSLSKRNKEREKERQQEKYIVLGDNSLNSGNYEEAKVYYQKAKDAGYDIYYINGKISEIERYEKEVAYHKTIAEADDLMSAERYTEAKRLYNKAKQQGNESYPSQQIQIINDRIEEIKAQEEEERASADARIEEAENITRHQLNSYLDLAHKAYLNEEYRTASAYAKEVLRMDPDNSSAQGILSDLTKRDEWNKKKMKANNKKSISSSAGNDAYYWQRKLEEDEKQRKEQQLQEDYEIMVDGIVQLSNYKRVSEFSSWGLSYEKGHSQIARIIIIDQADVSKIGVGTFFRTSVGYLKSDYKYYLDKYDIWDTSDNLDGYYDGDQVFYSGNGPRETTADAFFLGMQYGLNVGTKKFSFSFINVGVDFGVSILDNLDQYPIYASFFLESKIKFAVLKKVALGIGYKYNIWNSFGQTLSDYGEVKLIDESIHSFEIIDKYSAPMKSPEIFSVTFAVYIIN